MAYLALYRKYRPITFEDMVGQEKIVKVLKNAVIHNKISHAYLFSGPRGTGKTTTAKLIARMVNCLDPIDGHPCGKCENCTKNLSLNEDVIEIDAASNNGVDEIRELRDKINLVPTKSKYKIYIIDEVHMLTQGAFNALLKTLEEPPSHAIFILATTEPHKVPLTVASRCQKFQFTKLSMEELFKRLKYISEKENILIDEESLYEIARLSDGGMRDAINLLDQLVAYKSENITIQDVHEINGTISYLEMSELMMNILTNQTEKIILFLDNIDKSGKDILKFAEELLIFIKDIILSKNTTLSNFSSDKMLKMKEINEGYSSKKLYEFVDELNIVMNNIRSSSYPLIVLEIFFLKLSDKFSSNEVKALKIEEKNKKIEEILIKEESPKEIFSKQEETIVKMEVNEEEKNVRINNTFATASKDCLHQVQSDWSKINDYVLDKNFGVIAGILKDTSVVAAGDEYLILVGKYHSVVDRVNMEMSEITNFFTKVFGKKYKAIALSDKDWLEEKEQYIKNVKSGMKYTLKESCESRNQNQIEKSDIDDLISTFGSDMIEYK